MSEYNFKEKIRSLYASEISLQYKIGNTENIQLLTKLYQILTGRVI